jgi:hypothetical protein
LSQHAAAEPDIEQLRADVKAADVAAMAACQQAAQLSAAAGKVYTPAEGENAVYTLLIIQRAVRTIQNLTDALWLLLSMLFPS